MFGMLLAMSAVMNMLINYPTKPNRRECLD